MRRFSLAYSVDHIYMSFSPFLIDFDVLIEKKILSGTIGSKMMETKGGRPSRTGVIHKYTTVGTDIRIFEGLRYKLYIQCLMRDIC